MSYAIRPPLQPPLEVTRRPRSAPGAEIHQIQWHATRGAAALDLQVQATETWFAHPANDRGGWGGSAEFVLGPDRRKGGAIEIVQFGNWWETYSSWSAGYGVDVRTTLPAARYGIAIEVAQSAALEPFSGDVLDACVWLVGEINAGLRTLGVPEIPPVHLVSWAQEVGAPVPRGHIGHDELANGRKLGKTDPGPLFPWAELMHRLAAPGAPSYEDGRRDGWRDGRLEMRREARAAVIAALDSLEVG